MDPMTWIALGSLGIAAYQAYSQSNSGEGKAGEGGDWNSTYTPGQQNILDQAINNGPQDITQNQGYGNGMEWLNSLFSDPEFFKNFEAPMQRQFQEETIPDLANRFAAQGSGGSLGSSGFRNQAVREAGNLHTNIAAMRGGLQQQGVNQSLQYAQQPITNYNDWLRSVMNPQPNNIYQPPNNPWAPVAGAAVNGYFQGQGMNQNNNQTPAAQPAAPALQPGQSPSTQGGMPIWA